MNARANWFIALAVPTSPWWHRVTQPPEGVRLFDPADVHMTVAFLGPCGEAAAETAFELAPTWPAGVVAAVLGPVRPMGNPRRPSALSAVVTDGAGVLSDAMLAVRGPMYERAGARPDDRPPRPHVTLARPRRRASSSLYRSAADWAGKLDLGNPRVTLSALVLYTHAEDRSVRLFREHAQHML